MPLTRTLSFVSLHSHMFPQNVLPETQMRSKFSMVSHLYIYFLWMDKIQTPPYNTQGFPSPVPFLFLAFHILGSQTKCVHSSSTATKYDAIISLYTVKTLIGIIFSSPTPISLFHTQTTSTQHLKLSSKVIYSRSLPQVALRPDT